MLLALYCEIATNSDASTDIHSWFEEYVQCSLSRIHKENRAYVLGFTQIS